MLLASKHTVSSQLLVLPYCSQLLLEDEIGWTDDCCSLSDEKCFPNDYSFVAAKWLWGPNGEKWWLWCSETLSAMVPHQNQSSLLADFLKSKMLEAKNIILKLG
jgi:hypothetical protein